MDGIERAGRSQRLRLQFFVAGTRKVFSPPLAAASKLWVN